MPTHDMLLPLGVHPGLRPWQNMRLNRPSPAAINALRLWRGRWPQPQRLLMVIHALHRLLQRGRFSIPAAMLEIQQELRVGANSVLAWVDDREVQTDNTVKSESSRIYQAYTSWCLTHGYKSVADSKFWSQLQAALPGLVKTRTRTPTRRLTITNVKFF